MTEKYRRCADVLVKMGSQGMWRVLPVRQRRQPTSKVTHGQTAHTAMHLIMVQECELTTGETDHHPGRSPVHAAQRPAKAGSSVRVQAIPNPLRITRYRPTGMPVMVLTQWNRSAHTRACPRPFPRPSA